MDVDEMQTKLATWAQDPSFRFDDIYNLLYDKNFLYQSYGRVKSNSGSRTAGVDGQTMEDFEKDLGRNLKDLRDRLKSKTYEPKPVKRTYIPKGDDEVRPLGIPTIKDRIVQESLRKVLEPIYETDFSDYSFGFRPNRCTHDARKSALTRVVTAKMMWVIDADVKGFFDNVNHYTMMNILRDRITDESVRDVIWKFLKAGIMEEGKYRHSTLGTPQGGIISPLLANIYLNELDQWAKKWTDLTSYEKDRRRENGKGNWHYVRYADDFLFLTNGVKEKAEGMKERIGDFVEEELDLTLSAKKTELVHLNDGLEYLGYRIERKANTGGTRRTIPKEAERDLKDKVIAATKGNTDVSVRAKFKALNAVLRGWSNYYKFATDAAKVFSDLDTFVWHRVTHWLAEKYKCSRGYLWDNILENSSPLRANGMTLYTMAGDSSTYRKSPTDKGHPYLEGEVNILDIIPGDEPWLANREERRGWRDKRWDALERDDWTCQECGKELYRDTAEVHHKRPDTGYQKPEDSNRLKNLVSLCVECHQDKESNRGFAT